MSSFVRNLARTVSGGGREGEMPISNPTTPLASPLTPRISCPSFNDFSLFTGEEFAKEYEQHTVDRASLDGSATRMRQSFRRQSEDFGWQSSSRTAPLQIPSPKLLGTSMSQTPTTPFANSSEGSCPTSASSMLTSAEVAGLSPTTRKRRFKEGKIDGLDYYEFCEVMRSY